MTYSYAKAQEPLAKGPWNRPFLDHQYYTLSLSEPCPAVDKDSHSDRSSDSGDLKINDCFVFNY